MSLVQRILSFALPRNSLGTRSILQIFCPAPLGVFRKVDVSLVEMAVDRFLGSFDRRVVAVVNDGSGHSAKKGVHASFAGCGPVLAG